MHNIQSIVLLLLTNHLMVFGSPAVYKQPVLHFDPTIYRTQSSTALHDAPPLVLHTHFVPLQVEYLACFPVNLWWNLMCPLYQVLIAAPITIQTRLIYL